MTTPTPHAPAAVRPGLPQPFALPVLPPDDAEGFSALLQREFKPRTEEARGAVESAVRTLAEQALLHVATLTDDAYSSIETIIARIDEKLSEQINLILHTPAFQQVESAWRGMHHLVHNTETDDKLKIRFMDISKDEMRRTVRRHRGIAWDQSPVFKRIYEEEYGQLGGEPYGCLVGDYSFARHASINVFTQTVLDTVQRGTVARWPVRTGGRGVV